MQNIVIDQPYEFIPPRFSRFWHWAVRWVLPRGLRKNYGITEIECVGAEKLRASLEAGHGVVLVSNHCRPCDPMVLDSLAAAVRRPFHVIASWHVFMTSRVQRFLLPRVGGFSVYREAMDRESLKCSVRTVAEAKFPLLIFAEGIITRCNDRLVNFMEGPAFIARAAAKQRAAGKTVIHPLFIRYFFEGNLEATVAPVIESIEKRLSWQVQDQLPMRERIWKIGDALLVLKELEYFGVRQTGDFRERLKRLIDRLLGPLEVQWCGGRHNGDVISRVKRLRSAILPGLVTGNLNEDERRDRWRQLADLYLVQQLHCYPGDYIENATPERMLETIERYEEDLTDLARPHPPLRAIILVGDAIDVSGTRDRSADVDSITAEVRAVIERLMAESAGLRRVQPTGVNFP
jgi:1-acyl-sn-glycerol-3-phosphate acyltransferase